MFQEYQTQIEELVDKIKTSEDDFFSKQGRYFEGRKTGHKLYPVKPDLVIKAPHENANVPIINHNVELPVEVRIDEHKDWGTGKKGFTIVFMTQSNGKEYIKTYRHGFDYLGNDLAQAEVKDWVEYVLPIVE